MSSVLSPILTVVSVFYRSSSAVSRIVHQLGHDRLFHFLLVRQSSSGRSLYSVPENCKFIVFNYKFPSHGVRQKGHSLLFDAT